MGVQVRDSAVLSCPVTGGSGTSTLFKLLRPTLSTNGPTERTGLELVTLGRRK